MPPPVLPSSTARRLDAIASTMVCMDDMSSSLPYSMIAVYIARCLA